MHAGPPPSLPNQACRAISDPIYRRTRPFDESRPLTCTLLTLCAVLALAVMVFKGKQKTSAKDREAAKREAAAEEKRKREAASAILYEEIRKRRAALAESTYSEEFDRRFRKRASRAREAAVARFCSSETDRGLLEKARAFMQEFAQEVVLEADDDMWRDLTCWKDGLELAQFLWDGINDPSILRDSDKWKDYFDEPFVCHCGGWRQWCCCSGPRFETGYAHPAFSQILDVDSREVDPTGFRVFACERASELSREGIVMPLGAEAFLLWGEWYELSEDRREGYAERERAAKEQHEGLSLAGFGADQWHRDMCPVLKYR